ncbi:FAD binding domain-containing protein [Pararoseomonas indoligenes]|uniref:FAD binding domain-containing protein n=1 Tax=Roseomonas indoligenes TaxID=2820811 RepID=A0A940N1W9_9PROT|nr:FAD binding domain-containing protein [Pararoseomonas indoligenes]MBP0495728.1 FAD binding domain-containing protein [Pararoseomonas indoligenes]
MKPPPFHYHAPRTEAEALALLAELAPAEGRILAGGQSLVPAMALRVARPLHLIDINGLPGLDRLDVGDGHLRIGPLVRHAMIRRESVPGPLGALLDKVRGHIAHLPIRTRGTVCGSLANADPASEWCLVVATLGGEMTARSLRGERAIAAEDFFQGFMATALEPDELLAGLRLPLLADGTRWGFHEFSRRAGDYAQAASLVVMEVRDGVVLAARIGIGAVEDRPRRLPEAEALLIGRAPTAELLRQAAATARATLLPTDDDPTRPALAEAMIRRALADAAGIALP